MILAFDVSTSIVGVAVMDLEGNLAEAYAVDLRKIDGLYNKALRMSDEITLLSERHSFTHVFVEEALQAFQGGASSAAVISLLNKFNGIVSWLCFEKLGAVPEHLNATSARSMAGIKVKRGEKAKEVVLEHLTKGPSALITVTLTRQGNPVAGTYDIADAVVIALAGRKIVNRSKANGDPV